MDLQAAFKPNKEKVTVIASNKVERYKDSHPDWQAISAVAIGKHFRADYVIELEVESVSLYEGSGQQLLKTSVRVFRTLTTRTGPSDVARLATKRSSDWPSPLDEAGGRPSAART